MTRKYFLIVLVSVLYTSLSAQLDSFRIDQSTFRFSVPQGWNLIFLKDTASPIGGQSNALFRHPSYGECTYSLIGIEIVNRKQNSEGRKKKHKKNKAEESFAEFRTIEQIPLFHYRSKLPPKRKCTNYSFYSTYLHRINDSLDLILFLNCMVPDSAYAAMEGIFRSVVDTFFEYNRETILLLKPWASSNDVLDSTSVMGRTLKFIVPNGWYIDKRFESDPKDPTGNKLSMSPIIWDKMTSIPAIIISVTEFDKKTVMRSEFVYDYDENRPKPVPNMISSQRIELVHENIHKYGFDTIRTQKFYFDGWGRKRITYYAQRFSIFAEINRKTYQIDVTFTTCIGDAMELQYSTEWFKEVCYDICKCNQFKKW